MLCVSIIISQLNVFLLGLGGYVPHVFIKPWQIFVNQTTTIFITMYYLFIKGFERT